MDTSSPQGNASMTKRPATETGGVALGPEGAVAAEAVVGAGVAGVRWVRYQPIPATRTNAATSPRTSGKRPDRAAVTGGPGARAGTGTGVSTRVTGRGAGTLVGVRRAGAGMDSVTGISASAMLLRSGTNSGRSPNRSVRTRRS